MMRLETQRENGVMKILCTLENVVQHNVHQCFCWLDTVSQEAYETFPSGPNGMFLGRKNIYI